MKKILFFIPFLYSFQLAKAQLVCNSGWLSMPQTSTINDFVSIGDVDLSGSSSLTVEASFYCEANFAQGGSNSINLVSKHQYNTDNNCNYLLRTVTAEIQTSKGFFATPINCDFIPKRINHVAMVYDGSKLSFYRNGFLISSIPAKGKIQNNPYLLTKIGNKSENNLSYNSVSWEPFRGFINEVRIWKVARTQAEINQFMNSSLPSPKNQDGLVAYYQFSSLKNLQGKNDYDGSVSGDATINSPTPNCNFIADSCVVKSVENIKPCDSWLKTPNNGSTANIGNLNVSGNQITVEGNFMCTSYSTPNFGGNLIAKHTKEKDVCYALSPHAAEISTSNNGYIYTLQSCPFELNKTYHVAMVYDGVSLKFYRNGFLMSQKPCSGKISQNKLNAIIGNGPATPAENQFIGNINEIRIWNVARTQAQLQTYMNTSLPNPSLQVGLLAYYTFDNLQNKQGNKIFNARLSGGATINATNPNCNFIADSCVEKPKPVESKSPSADLEYSISKCNEVTFSLANEKNIQSVQWIVDNKTVSTANKFSHIYTTDSDYEITLSILGTNGETKEINKLILVQKPKALFNLSTTKNPYKIQFKNNPKENINYTWDFGDGEILNSNSAKSITHSYAKDGTYTVALTATDNAMGCSSTYTEKLVIGKPTATEITNISLAPEPKTTTANNLPLLDIAPEKRIEVLVQQIEVTNDSIQVSFYDNGVIDGDSITVKYNNKIIVEHLLLTSNGKSFYIKVEPSPYQNELVMIAENLGSIPPNTSLMIIYDGKKRHEVNISSSNSSNGKIAFVLKR